MLVGGPSQNRVSAFLLGGHDSHPLWGGKPNEGETREGGEQLISRLRVEDTGLIKWLRDMQLILLLYFLGPITTRLKIPLQD